MIRSKRILLSVLVILGMACCGWALQQQYDLNTLQSHLSQGLAWRDQHPQLTSLAFLGFYTAVCALALPGAALMTLAAGALFGLFWGTLLVSFASSLGATLAFLGARYFWREPVQHYLGHALAPINRGMEREGALYLFALRLMPVVPFFMLNLLMGLTPLKTVTFYWVSQLGMLPATLLYVNAGRQLQHLKQPSDLLSPTVWISFTLLGLFPLLVKYLSQRLRTGLNVAQSQVPAGSEHMHPQPDHIKHE